MTDGMTKARGYELFGKLYTLDLPQDNSGMTDKRMEDKK